MTMNHNELLSALIDGELQGEKLDKALQLLATDEQAAAQFQRYQQITDILHDHSKQGAGHNFIDRVLATLEIEPAYSIKTNKHKAEVITLLVPFWKQFTGLALAASVGALAVVGVMSQSQSTFTPNTPIATIDVPNEVMTVAQTGVRWTVDEPEVENRLNNYLLDHNEQTGSSGVFSYARVVSYVVE